MAIVIGVVCMSSLAKASSNGPTDEQQMEELKRLQAIGAKTAKKVAALEKERAELTAEEKIAIEEGGRVKAEDNPHMKAHEARQKKAIEKETGSLTKAL